MRAAILKSVRALSLVGFAFLFSVGVSAEVYYSDSVFQVSGSGNRSSRECTVTLQPSRTLGGEDAPRLMLVTTGQDRLTADIRSGERYQDMVIVQNNKRTPFVAAVRETPARFSDSAIAKAIKSGKMFFITARQTGAGDFVSSRYEAISFDAILNQIEVNCPFDAESLMSDLSDRRREEDELDLSYSATGLIRWVLRKKYHGENGKPDQATLTQDDRKDLKRYAAENDYPISSYLTASLARELVAEGKVLETTQAPRAKVLRTVEKMDLGGNDYLVLRNETVSACHSRCQSDTQCQAYTYDRWNRVCFLKTSVGGMLRFEPRSVTGMIEGASPDKDPRPLVMQKRRGKRFPDDPYDRTYTSSYDECSRTCLFDSRCAGFNYSGGSCSLIEFPSEYFDGGGVDLGMKIQPP
jgi:hypothetical protein